ncbi:hypothetical protein pb186bvf_019065 [Paramecium bursaria]
MEIGILHQENYNFKQFDTESQENFDVIFQQFKKINSIEIMKFCNNGQQTNINCIKKFKNIYNFGKQNIKMGRIINLIYHNIFPNWIKKVIDTYCKKSKILTDQRNIMRQLNVRNSVLNPSYADAYYLKGLLLSENSINCSTQSPDLLSAYIKLQEIYQNNKRITDQSNLYQKVQNYHIQLKLMKFQMIRMKLQSIQIFILKLIKQFLCFLFIRFYIIILASKLQDKKKLFGAINYWDEFIEADPTQEMAYHLKGLSELIEQNMIKPQVIGINVLNQNHIYTDSYHQKMLILSNVFDVLVVLSFLGLLKTHISCIFLL